MSSDRQATAAEDVAIGPASAAAPPSGKTPPREKRAKRRVRAGSRSGIDFVLILVASFVLTGVFIYLLQLYDVIHFTGRARLLGSLPNYLYYHLRSSIFFFAADLFFFLFSLRAMSQSLKAFPANPGDLLADQRKDRLAAIYSLDTRTDMAITTFFGIGVIYTAIGMESALLTALGGIRGAEDAARQGAWQILRKLVDGGLILALSTTICGGIGGYTLRMLKHALVGRRLTVLALAQEGEVEALLLRTNSHVQEIREMLHERRAGQRG